MGTRLMQELGRDREPIASLSLLGEKSKVQNSRESGKSNQLTSRQEQIINQILKLVKLIDVFHSLTAYTPDLELELKLKLDFTDLELGMSGFLL